MEGNYLGTLMQSNPDYRLLLALAEELKLPLLQIARTSEFSGSEAVQRTAEMALKLVDGYVLGLQSTDQVSLRLEPVTLASILYDTAEALAPIAKQQGYELRVDIGGKFGPVMGDRHTLQTAFTVLGYELMTVPAEDTASVLTLATHRGKPGIVAGIFTNNTLLTKDSLRRARALVGTARQTMPTGSASNGVGIFIADNLLKNLSTSLNLARHHKQTGLATSLLPSRQLQLV
ncbi:hypothetical protein H0X10_03375 [Candidatus Saccharibacteria bacterium]|nr:hypothetical protein [Candidatus Saccharibacteria bacterium]